MNKEEAKRGSLIQSTAIRRRTGLHLGINPKRRGLDEPLIYITQIVVDIVNLLLREGDQSPGKGSPANSIFFINLLYRIGAGLVLLKVFVALLV
jgi:hypothetical protein